MSGPDLLGTLALAALLVVVCAPVVALPCLWILDAMDADGDEE